MLLRGAAMAYLAMAGSLEPNWSQSHVTSEILVEFTLASRSLTRPSGVWVEGGIPHIFSPLVFAFDLVCHFLTSQFPVARFDQYVRLMLITLA